MKKYLFLILLLLGSIILPRGVYAANYGIRELIPIGVHNTLVTHNFSYKDFYYNTSSKDGSRHTIYFKGIKNLSDEEKPISISIALFGSNKKNIGTINYCGKTNENRLNSKEEKVFSIPVTSEYIADNNVLDDISYIAVLSDNIGCNEGGSLSFIGQTVEEIGYKRNNTLNDDTVRMFKIMTVVGAILVGLFLYRFLFTTAYENVDGDSTRREFVHRNKMLREEREFEERVHPKPVKEPKKTKTDEVLRQEEEARKEDKDHTELHDFYR
ncbi:MAG: hypothetical protein IKE70_03765 [Bacilli bacterium]|nr:hypothetical protein [Bacilli bacterium]